MRRFLLAAAAAGLFVVAPRAARAEEKPALPDQFIGVMLRFPVGTFVGARTNEVAEPEGGYGISLQWRLFASRFWLDLGYDQRIPMTSTVPLNGYSLGVGQTTLGVRGRLPIGSSTNVVLGAGAGGGTLRHINTDSKAYGGPMAYGTLGLEWEVFSKGSSAGVVGVEAHANDYFVYAPQVGFHGGLVEGRVAFSYYFGGEEAADCY